MTLANYADLQAALPNWLKRSDLSSFVPDLIALGEAELFLDLLGLEHKPRDMENSDTGTLSGQTLALPSKYAGTKSFILQVGGSPRPLTYKTSDQLGVYSGTGIPAFFTALAANLEFGPPPDSNNSYSYRWIYWTLPDKLVDAQSGVNWIMTSHPNLYLFAALKQAAPFMKNDERILVWQGLYSQYLDKLELAAQKERYSGRMQVRSDAAIK